MKNKTKSVSAHSTTLLFQDIASHCEDSKRHRLYTICREGMPVGGGHFEGLEDVMERFLDQLLRSV